MNEIHSTAIIGSNVQIGKGNKILPYTVIYGPTTIGDDNIIGPHVIIGTPGQDTRNKYYDSSDSRIEIGSRNIIREFTAIQKPCYEDLTFIGNDVFLMQSVHIPHDCHIYDGVVITPMCVLAGITRILEGATLGMGATVNQYTVIGQHSIVATGAAAMKDLKPFSKFVPNRPLSVNSYLVKKAGLEVYLPEIEKYVVDDIYPDSEPIKLIVDKFEELRKKYNRPKY